jgi:DNA-directed RNA polymerase specialized sigma24 family protein
MTKRQPVSQPLSHQHALRRRLTTKQLEVIIMAYRAGSTPAELAQCHGISKSGLVALLHEHGLAVRNHGLTKEQVEIVRQLRAEGYTYVSIAERFGVHRSTVWHAVNGA